MGDSESEYDWEAEELGEEESDVKQTGRKQNSRRFSPAQVACFEGLLLSWDDWCGQGSCLPHREGSEGY